MVASSSKKTYRWLGILLATTLLTEPLSSFAKETKTEKSKSAAVNTKAAVTRPTVLFEGYAKILLDQKHVGYIVSRYQFDPKKKEFISTQFMKTDKNAGDITESLKARARQDFTPIEYQYTSISAGKTKTIDATFSGRKINAVIREGQQTRRVQNDLPKNTFLSTFLVYMMLSQKDGLKPETRYTYSAISEEDAMTNVGEAFVAAQETIQGLTAFRVTNRFKGATFLSYATATGDILATASAAQNISTELVRNIAEATAGQSVNSNTLTLLFGEGPLGQVNALSKTPEPPANKAAEPAKGS